MKIVILLSFLALASCQFPCEDTTKRCLMWKDKCSKGMYKYYMELNCRQTCNLCPKCEDKIAACDRSTCLDNYDFNLKNCPLACGFCSVPTTAPPTPPIPTFPVIPAGACGVQRALTSRVINGVDAKKGAWPWQVLIRFLGDTHCGGSIISPFWILTAAHCVDKRQALIDEFQVVVGDNDFNVYEGTETSIGVEKIIMHEQYSKPTVFDKDIALLKLNRPIPFDRNLIGTVCLPDKDKPVPVGTSCFISGWGKINPWDSMHHKLQQAMLPIVDNKKCDSLNVNSTKIPVTSNMLCAGHGPNNPTGGCHGDSGGPLVCQTGSQGRWQIHGAVSWGDSHCNTTQAYTVFARVTNFREWIDQKIALN